jgi:selenocysteine lyase/cysteine desulfurase
MLAAHFSKFFDANPGRLHFVAHSHHPWPDATEAAHTRYWIDSNALADRKWDKVFGEIVPTAQAHVARVVRLPHPRQIAFAPNTHEFVTRLYSCLENPGKLRVLSSAHEFHSFKRQTRRYVEAGRVDLQEVPGPPWNSFAERFIAAARSEPWDMIWLSHVFFDSAFVVKDLEAIVAAAPPDALVVIDGYHAFCSMSVDLSRIHSRVFYMGGSYKYAMAGEGACFLAVPIGCRLRPVDTGWFATFSTMTGSQKSDQVPYSDDGFRFWGATFDSCGLYRLNASMEWLISTGYNHGDVHRHAHRMQERFLVGLEHLGLAELRPGDLVPPLGAPRGNFLVFDVDDAEARYKRITQANIGIDRRDRRLRFGFGVYHDDAQVDRLLETLGRTLR